jgi:hypothetical protein
MLSDTPLEQSGVASPRLAVEVSLALLLDGYGWRPLSTEWDYRETRRRVQAEAFPAEVVAGVLGDGGESVPLA